MSVTSPSQNPPPQGTPPIVELVRAFAQLRLYFRDPIAVQREKPRLGINDRLAMLAIADNEPLRLHELADAIRTTTPVASRVIERLVTAGLVERTTDPDDRRAVRITLTPKGHQRIDRGRAQTAALLEEVLAGFSTRDRQRLLELIRRVNQGFLEAREETKRYALGLDPHPRDRRAEPGPRNGTRSGADPHRSTV